jgi:3-methyl-2-oxobutanoate hydroxymethyltransferase
VAKFVKQYANLKDQASAAISDYVREVRSGQFPAKEHCY